MAAQISHSAHSRVLISDCISFQTGTCKAWTDFGWEVSGERSGSIPDAQMPRPGWAFCSHMPSLPQSHEWSGAPALPQHRKKLAETISMFSRFPDHNPCFQTSRKLSQEHLLKRNWWFSTAHYMPQIKSIFYFFHWTALFPFPIALLSLPELNESS